MNALGACIGTIGMIPCCPCPNPFKEVDQGSVGLVSRFGQFYKAVDPGLVKINVCSEQIRIVGMLSTRDLAKDRRQDSVVASAEAERADQGQCVGRSGFGDLLAWWVDVGTELNSRLAVPRRIRYQ